MHSLLAMNSAVANCGMNTNDDVEQIRILYCHKTSALAARSVDLNS